MPNVAYYVAPRMANSYHLSLKIFSVAACADVVIALKTTHIQDLLMRTAYFVLGMHRSGTSALASALDGLGITLGESLLPPSKDNPKGYFENRAVQEFNETLLVSKGHGWDDVFFDILDINEIDYQRLVASAARILEREFGNFEDFAVKDPRTCLLLPLWADACRKLDIVPKVILAHRHPLEIAKSLQKRNGMALNNAIALWADHMFKAEIYSRDLERLLVSYEDLLDNFDSVAASFSKFTNGSTSTELEQSSVIDTSLRHHKIRSKKFINVPVCLSELLSQYENNTLDASKIDAAYSEFSKLKSLFFNADRTALFQKTFEERKKYKTLKDDYFQKLQKNEAKAKASTEEIEIIKKDLAKQKNEKKDLVDSIRERDERIRGALDKLKAQEKENGDLTHKLQKAEIDQKIQSQKIEVLNSDILSMQQMHEKKQQELSQAEQNVTELSDINIALTKDISALESELKESSAHIEQLKIENTTLRQNLKDASSKNESAIKKNTQLEKDIGDVKTELKKQKEIIASLQKEAQEKAKQYQNTIQEHLNAVNVSLDNWVELVINPISKMAADYSANKEKHSRLQASLKAAVFSGRFDKALERLNKNLLVARDIPAEFIVNFDEAGYFTCNEDVEVAIENGEFSSGLDHFLKFGFDETMQGKRKLHPKGALFLPNAEQNEDVKAQFIDYLSSFYSDIQQRLELVKSKSEQKVNESVVVTSTKLVDAFTQKDKISDNAISINKRPAPNYISTLVNRPSVDIILPVYNALDDVKACIESLYRNETIPFNLIIIDDCSGEQTKSWLESAQQEYGFKLSRNEENLRFTKTVNRGFSQSEGDFVVLLNSDTIVTEYWLEKILCCFESDRATGIVGPLSNAASWQTVPVREDKVNGGWLVNEIPEGYSIDLMGQLVETVSQRQYPSVPSVNGFCYVIKRDVIKKIGTLDEEYFPTGYGEEDDFSIRARKAGFSIRVADDTYVFHAKSKSYTKEVRKVLTVGGRKSLDKKHGKEEIEKLIAAWKSEPLLPEIGRVIESYMHISSGNRKVVYTAIFGNYDHLKTPEYVNPNWDYVCFTDNRNVKSDVFTVKHVDQRFGNVTKNARMVKLLSHLFLINYDYSLWVDGSVKLRGKNIDELITNNLASDYISLHNHVKRDCVYEEADACMLAKKDGNDILAIQIAEYRNEGLPESVGVFETAQLARRHQAPEVALLNALWWRQLDAYSIRDQVALPYVFWKHNFKSHQMEGTQWLDPYFHMYKHRSAQNKHDTTVEIIVKVESASADINKLVNNIFQKTHYSNFTLTMLLGNNGSFSNIQKATLLQNYSGKLKFVEDMKGNVPSSLNTYIKRSASQLCCLLTDDTAFFNSDWLDVLVDGIMQDEHATFAGPTILNENFDFVASSVRVKRKQGKLKEVFNARKLGGTGAVLAVHQACILFDRQQFVKLGGFNSIFKSLRSAAIELFHRNTTDKKHTLLVSNSEVIIKNDCEKVEMSILEKLL